MSSRRGDIFNNLSTKTNTGKHTLLGSSALASLIFTSQYMCTWFAVCCHTPTLVLMAKAPNIE